MPSIESSRDKVILVHGIRTHAQHFPEIREALEKAGFQAIFTNYGRFDLLRFLLPFSLFRNQASEEVWEQIEEVLRSREDGQKVHIISHSFGTYIVGNLLERKNGFVVNRLVLCGSVLPYKFKFSNYKHKFEGDVLNEVGTRDFWPAVAETVTVGYGSAGTYGFKRPNVVDRWHNKMSHSAFNNASFCVKFWIPFLKKGEVVSGNSKIERTPTYIQLLKVFQPRMVLPAILVALIISFRGSSGAEPVDPTSPLDSLPIQKASVIKLDGSDFESADGVEVPSPIDETYVYYPALLDEWVGSERRYPQGVRRSVTWRIEGYTAGRYKVIVEYAAPTSRPMRLLRDEEVIFDGFAAATTRSGRINDSIEEEVGTMSLSENTRRISLDTVYQGGSWPHIFQLKLVPIE